MGPHGAILVLLLPPLAAESNESTWDSQLHAVNDASATLRRLAGDEGHKACESLFTLPTPGLLEFQKCVNTEAASADLGVPGVDLRIRAECACTHRVFEAIQALGCCEHPDFKQLCETECNPDCDSEAATNCVEQCPALCLERDYAPTSCAKTCTSGECHRHVLCITAHAAQAIETGNMERVCHERLFAESEQMKDFHSCQVLHPHRSVWQRQNAAKHCICESKLAAAVVEATCCESSWGKDICNAPCGAVDCGSDEGQRCLALCSEACAQMESISQNCYMQCFEASATCSKYDICPPTTWPSHGYICDDGSEPMKTGCCAKNPRGGPGGSTCPLMCDAHKSYPIATGDGHRYECFCEGCPSTVEEGDAKFHLLMENELHANGQSILNAIAMEVGLKYPTRRMQQLMDERNAEIMKVVKSGKNGAEQEREIGRINEEYVEKIRESGKRGPEDDTGSQSPQQEEGDESNVYFIIAVAAVVVALISVCAAVWAVRSRRKGPRVIDMSVGQSPTSAAEIQRRADELRQANDAMSVVVGQPVGNRALQGQAPPRGVVQSANKADLLS
eukprot:gnl/MRDRNA2_/MRDRNA2_86721_c6_seq1.p1 gnl/MRDRNA2_/MRDRNA2_86721_c6~~gnl/MRDRNA2_/MRDRNA2_86721_c6_seq1.p1  ORF type:complete len:563 (+),score=77.00 gnl/MRDRNA2_/MRDRNA2_86721_c6_seq1:53-1741(+)